MIDSKLPARSEKGLEKLNVTPAQVAAVPQIGPLVKRVGRNIDVFALLKGSADLTAQRVAGLMAQFSLHDISLIPMEAWAIALQMPTPKLLALIVEVAFSQSKLEGDVIAAVAHPKIVEQVAEMAKAGDLSAAEMMFKHQKFVPIPRNQIVLGDQNVDARVQTVQVLPSLDQGARKMTERFNEQKVKLLDAPEPQLDDDSDDDEEE